MSDHIPVEGKSGFYRDSESTAIINKDKKAYAAYMQRKRSVENKNTKLINQLDEWLQRPIIDINGKRYSKAKKYKVWKKLHNKKLKIFYILIIFRII